MRPNQAKQTANSVLLLLPKDSYRGDDFLQAAKTLGIEVIVARNLCQKLADNWRLDTLLSIPFKDPAKAAKLVQQELAGHLPQAVIGIDDQSVEAAAAIAEVLHIKSNSPLAVGMLHDKYRFRKLQQQLGLPVPAFLPIQISGNRVSRNQSLEFPCVVKPTRLSGSRGVIRVNTAAELDETTARVGHIIDRCNMGTSGVNLMLEKYLEGSEYALEAIMDRGELRTLTIFDKPDALEGPYFEETIYITPSHLPQDTRKEFQRQVQLICQQAGILDGPVHAEARIHHGTVTLLEAAPRSIGGSCGKVLRHVLGMSLEELILRHALGDTVPTIDDTGPAAGVMMLPVPVAGIFNVIDGVEEVQTISGIDAVEASARPGDRVLPLPEESIYLGFVFASGESPEFVVSALREARDRLQIRIKPMVGAVTGS